MGMLGKEAILDLENKIRKPSCYHPNCNLRYDEHETALLVKCKIKDDELLREYLKSIVKQCEQDGFAGFTLMDAFSKETK